MEMYQPVLKFIQKYKELKIAETFLKKYNIQSDTTRKTTEAEERAQKQTHTIYGHMIDDKDGTSEQWGKDELFNKGCLDNWISL